jgi:DNA-binding CsgD family transcriptional regulator
MAKRGRPRYRDILTPREWEVLSCIRDNLSNEEIRKRLGISLDGVKYHVTEILTKLGLENRHDAARWRPDEEKRGRVLSPLLFWRRLGVRWLSPALVGGLAVGIAVGAGVLVWALLATGRGATTQANVPATNQRALAAYVVVGLSSDPYAPLSLKAVDPFTGADVPGRDPIALGHDGVEALSPDGSMIALGWSAPDSGGKGPQGLSVLDTRRWTKRDTGVVDFIQKLFWSSDGSKIYAVTRSCLDCQNWRLIAIDAQAGTVETTVQLPFYSFPTSLSPDGKVLYMFGAEYADPQVVAQPPPPRLVAIDVTTGDTRGEVTFSDMLSGSRLEHDASGGYFASYQPGVAMSPDGHHMYVGYPDRDRIAVVDLASFQIERTVEIERQTSLMDDFLSLFAKKAEAKGGPTDNAILYVSADGRSLYYNRTGEHSPADANGNYQKTTVGPWLLDVTSLSVTRELKASDMESHLFLPGASTKYVFALRGFNVVVLDPQDLHQISGGVIGAVYDLVVGPAPT